MPPKLNPDSARAIVQAALDSDPTLTTHQLWLLTKERGLNVLRETVHNIRAKYWKAQPEKRKVADEHKRQSYKQDRINQNMRLTRKAQRMFCRLNLEIGEGIRYFYFGSLSLENRKFIMTELSNFNPPITFAKYLELIITDARLDAEELAATKKRVKAWDKNL